jgi:hypothetical protein
VKGLSNFSYSLVQGLRKFLEIHRKFQKFSNKFCRSQDVKPHLLDVHLWLDSKKFWQKNYKYVMLASVIT